MPEPELEPIAEETKMSFKHTLPLDAFYFHPDHLGSSSYITNLAGNVSQHMEYLPFGETLVDEHLNSRNSPFKYNGKEFDEETGNYYYSARYYDPKWSIFVSVDPLAEKYPSHSPYAYCVNNPINVIDPDGRDIIYVNSAGGITKIVKNGNPTITIMDGGKAHKLSDYTISKSTSSSSNQRSRQVVANVAGYYGKQVGITGIGATFEKEGLAHYNPDKKKIYIAPQENGKVDPLLNNLNNLISTMVHENKHKKDHADGIETTYISHASVYLYQMKDETFESTTKDYAEGMMGGFIDFLQSAKYYRKDGVDEMINDFNKSDIKGGYKIRNRDSGGILLITPEGKELLLPLAPVKTDPN